MTPDPAALAVLLDAARTALGEVEATPEEVVAWLRHASAVRTLLDRELLEEMDDGAGRSVGCGSCLEEMDQPHADACMLMRALECLDAPRGHAECGRAWDAGAAGSPFTPPVCTHTRNRQLRERDWVIFHCLDCGARRAYPF